MLRLEELDEGTRTRVLRVAAGLSQHDLALRAHVDRRRLSEFERNQVTALDPDARARLRAVLNAISKGGTSEAEGLPPEQHRPFNDVLHDRSVR